MPITNREIRLIAKWWNEGWREAEIRALLKREAACRKRKTDRQRLAILDSINHE